MNVISVKDKERIRELANRVNEVANSESMNETIRLWKLHNACNGERPMIRVELDTFAGEIIPPLQVCENEAARELEWQLLSRYINPVMFGDDSVVRDFFPVSTSVFFKAFDLDITIEYAKDGIGRHFVPVLRDLGEDLHKIRPSTYGINRDKTKKRSEFISDLIDDILPVKMVGMTLYTVLTQDIVHIMSMEDMYSSMVECPELFESMINSLADDYVKFYNYLSSEGVLLPTVEDEAVGQGTYCYTTELPDKIPDNSHLSSKDVWGFADSQETVGISESMFRELVFPAYKKVTQSYGQLSYGCCEPIDRIWDSCLSKLSNLRKLSISPWCDEAFMGDKLKGTNVIYHRKPSATYLGVGKNLDEDGLRASIRKTLECAKDNTIEFTQRDVYTVNHSISKVKRYVDIVMEEITK